MIQINICKDFSDTPGGRYKREGNFSGEEFRENILLPKYNYALESGEKLSINFDGCFGFGTSFLEEAFGGLVRVHKKKNILSHILLISEEDETVPELIEQYVNDAEKRLGK